MMDASPYSVPKEPGRWRAISLAVVVHLALLAFLWFGVRWQSETPAGVEAEVWSPQNHEAAPRPEPPPAVEKKPEPQPEPKPEPKPVVKETPKPPVAEPVRENPEIALEQEKKRKAQQEQQQRREREEHEKQAKLKQQEQEREEQREQQAKKERLEREKVEAQAKQQKAEALAKQKAEAQAQKEKDAEQAKKTAAAAAAAAEKKRKQDAQDAAAADKRRADDLKRMQAQAGTGGAGSAPTTQGSRADSGYVDKVGARIKSNTIFNVPDGLSGNPAVEFAVELLPDGSIRALKKVKSSGVSGFDEAVQRAIGKSAPFPPDKTGRVPASFNVVHHPKDQ
jgi:colicin import membrane protein